MNDRIITKTKIGLVLIFISTASFVFGQSYTISPNDTINIKGGMEDMATLLILQNNNTSNPLSLRWKKVSESIPDNWEASVCDNQMCYTSLVDSGEMNPVLSGEYGLLLLHITPRVNYGTANVRYAVWDTVNADFRDTLTYILTVEETVKTKSVRNQNAYEIFPNPANNKFNILTNNQSGFHFVMYDIFGKLIFSEFSNSALTTVNTVNLANGVYSLIINNNTSSITTKFFIQH